MAEQQSEQSNQFLTFVLCDEIFALDISKVCEVLDCADITRVPQAPDYMCGVINLRGSVVPVVDMHCKFKLDASAKTVNTCIIIIEVELDGEKTVVGAVADSVREVVDLDADQIVAPPRIGTKLNTEFIRGMGKLHDGFVIILDIDRVFGGDGDSENEGQ